MCAGGCQLHNKTLKTRIQIYASPQIPLQGTWTNKLPCQARWSYANALLYYIPQVELEVDGVCGFARLQLQQPGVIMRGREARLRAALNQGNAESGDVLEIADAEVVLAESGTARNCGETGA